MNNDLVGKYNSVRSHTHAHKQTEDVYICWLNQSNQQQPSNINVCTVEMRVKRLNKHIKC